MRPSGLSGPYALGFDEIGAAATQHAPGVYLLGHTDAEGLFRISHVGRSDHDLTAELRTYIGTGQAFKFGYTASAQAAFERECELFHDFRPPCTRVHPSRARGSSWACPRCRIFEVDA